MESRGCRHGQTSHRERSRRLAPSRTGSRRCRSAATSGSEPRETPQKRIRCRGFLEPDRLGRRARPACGKSEASVAGSDGNNSDKRSRSTPARNVPQAPDSSFEPSFPHQAQRVPHGSSYVHLAAPLFIIVSKDERHLAEDEVHAAELEKYVHHALEAVLIEELIPVSRDRVLQDLGTVRAIATRIVPDPVDRKDRAEQPGRAGAHDASQERHPYRPGALPVSG